MNVNNPPYHVVSEILHLHALNFHESAFEQRC